ncbi:hypothetical protein HYH03_008718 [Edaphochlamys debaryana]|uniref:Rieske domain-containing protein n=1 Tax=Edaphochlamys debaryana TaxID=47281 RepID=A0A835Y5W3_9CHLO|nr:hypothetical protein HYH03_008718 [Edaphochlamys debaryana]|eukprot:KAG2493055.1 hypothetical protein HYH03_008718 [Edaphochlamys debaryana]
MLPASLHKRSACAGRSARVSRAPAGVRVAAFFGQQQQQQETVGTSVPSIPKEDPEAKYSRYGKHFGGLHKLNLDWLDNVPRVRVRTNDSRQLDELLELAVLNERLSGRLQPWQARQKLDYLRKRRKNWERIFEYVTKTDASATLAMIEEANRMVEESLSEETREKTAVGDLKEQLMDLQQQVQDAKNRLQLTESRVSENLKRVTELKAEASALERIRGAEDAPAVVKDVAAAKAVGTLVTERPAKSATATVERPSTSGREGGAAAESARRTKAQIRNRRGLSSSLDFEEGLRNFWYPAEFSDKLVKDTMVPFDMFGEPWVLFRDESGKPCCIKDECAHRACPLSIGKVVEGQVVCAYHGWEFNGEGSCTKMPSTPFCRNVGVAALPCAEKDGFVWVWPGDGLPAESLPDFTKPPPGYTIHSELMMEVPVEHGLLIENLLDLAHAPFTHTSTFARGWPVPDFVKFHANKVLSGYWDPYPIDMFFHPPCMTVSNIGLAQPGKVAAGATAAQCKTHLHQLHVCLPSKKGHTRLLYRMSMDFMPWVRHVPFIQTLWKQVAKQVLGEDLVLVVGQQDRLQRGGDTWANPAPYDKLAVRYRRWRNNITEEQARLGPGQVHLNPVGMSAGEMFAIEDDGLE